MTHRDQISEANRRILELEREKQRIEKELSAWTQIRDAHELLTTGNNVSKLVSTEIGPTEAIKVILGKNPDGLTPVEIREALAGYGISCGSDKNFLGNIHKIIKRHKEITEVGVGGRRVYKLRIKPSGQ